MTMAKFAFILKTLLKLNNLKILFILRILYGNFIKILKYLEKEHIPFYLLSKHFLKKI